MTISLPSLFLTYAVFWYGAFHLATRPPTEINSLVYYLSLFHLILSFAYLLFIHPLNMLASSDVGNTNPTHCLKRALMNQSFDNALHRKAKLTKSGSFPAVTSSRMRCRGPTKLDHKQGEIWPPSQGKESAHGFKDSTAKLMPLLHEIREGGSKRTITSSKVKLPPIKRASLLTESMDRYAQTYETCSKKEITNMDALRDVIELDVNTKDGSSIDNVTVGRNRRDKPGSVLMVPCEEDEMCSIKYLMSEGNLFESGLQSQSTTNLEKGKSDEIPEGGQFSPMELLDEEYKSEFYYVKNVLELSGFIRKDKPSTWYSLEQPINPNLFEEIERHYYYDDLDLLQSSTETESEESYRVRELIFDLINEALVYINEKPYLYYPKALSLNCHVYPIPRGRRLLDEVWALVGRSLHWRPNPDALLVAYDLNPNDGWMNLQIESERFDS